MSRDFDGQLDFLGLISEYTDDQGATVRVREPGLKRKKKKEDANELQQISFDFYESPINDTANEVESVIEEEITESLSTVISEPEEDAKTEAVSEIQIELEPEAVLTEIEVASVKPEIAGSKPEETITEQELLFKACKKCWCRDCKHNSRNEGVPRNLCGTMMACPACAGCIEEDNPTICEIGNAKEGCMTRALEEGIVVKEEYLG